MLHHSRDASAAGGPHLNPVACGHRRQGAAPRKPRASRSRRAVLAGLRGALRPGARVFSKLAHKCAQRRGWELRGMRRYPMPGGTESLKSRVATRGERLGTATPWVSHYTLVGRCFRLAPRAGGTTVKKLRHFTNYAVAIFS